MWKGSSELLLSRAKKTRTDTYWNSNEKKEYFFDFYFQCINIFTTNFVKVFLIRQFEISDHKRHKNHTLNRFLGSGFRQGNSKLSYIKISVIA